MLVLQRAQRQVQLNQPIQWLEAVNFLFGCLKQPLIILKMKKQTKIFSLTMLAILILAITSFVLVGNKVTTTGQAIRTEVQNQEKDYSQPSLVDGIEKYESDLRQITCYCGCNHTDLYNCYEENMLTNCGTCMGEYKDYLSMRNTNTIQEISAYIDQKYPGMEDNDED